MGAIGFPSTAKADVIFVQGGRHEKDMFVRPEPTRRNFEECERNKNFTLEEVYHHLAFRWDRERDAYRAFRKYVVHIDWIEASTKANRQLLENNFGGFEIR